MTQNRWLLAGIAACIALPGYAVDLDRQMDFNIRAQKLDMALVEFSRQAKIQVITSGAEIRNLETNGAMGRLTISTALEKLLKDSGLRFSPVGESAVSIKAPTAGVKPAAALEGSATTSDSLEGERLRLAQATSAYSSPAGSDDEDVPVDEPAAEHPANSLEQIVVTGTHIRGLPKEYIASPVFTYTGEDIERSGFNSLAEYIPSLPQNFSGDASEASTTGVGAGAGIGGAFAANANDGFSSFSLRGLGSDATVTLFNGRRMPNAGMIEAPTVSFIPTALIERIEVVPDGASATYGADAVGGVVNLITRRNFDGLEMRVRGSTATEVDRNDYQASLAAGHSWGSGNVFGMAAWQEREALVGDPREVAGQRYQVTASPNERVSSFFGGASQSFGDVKVSLEGQYFDTRRDSFYLTLPANRRDYLTEGQGHSIFGTVEWQAGRATFFDLMVDYHENKAVSDSSRMGTLLTHRENINRLVSAEAHGQTELFSLPGGQVQLAGGVQYRRETLVSNAVAFFPGGGGEEEVRSVFSEVFLPIVGEGQQLPFMKSLTLSAAARYEDFGDPVGSEIAPKFGVRWRINDAFSLRGTYSESFLVPRLRDTAGTAEQVSFLPMADAFLDPAQQDPRLPAGQSLVMFRAGSNPQLVAQDAKAYTVGVDFTPAALPGFELGVGYYRVEFTNRIAAPLPNDILQLSGLSKFADRDPTPAELLEIISNPNVSRLFTFGVPYVSGGGLVFFNTPADIPANLLAGVQVIGDARMQNFAREMTDGLDVELRWQHSMFGGEGNFRLNGQYIFELERQTTPEVAPISRVDTVFFPVDLTATAALGWQRGSFSMGSTINYVDAYRDNRVGRNNRRVGSYTTASLTAGWNFRDGPQWLSGSSVRLVVANVFDQQPPEIIGDVLAFSPLNTPANPRTVALILSKRL